MIFRHLFRIVSYRPRSSDKHVVKNDNAMLSIANAEWQSVPHSSRQRYRRHSALTVDKRVSLFLPLGFLVSYLGRRLKDGVWENVW